MVEGTAKKARALVYGVIRNPPGRPLTACLAEIHKVLTGAILAHEPDQAAIEAVIYAQSVRTAITLGTARGAALLAVAQKNVPTFEYAPRRIKQAVVGRGGAEKSQVAFMIRAFFGLEETPGADAADALAIALTHLRQVESPIRNLSELAEL